MMTSQTLRCTWVHGSPVPEAPARASSAATPIVKSPVMPRYEPVPGGDVGALVTSGAGLA